MLRMWLSLMLAGWAACAVAVGQVRTVDDFAKLDAWKVITSDGVKMTIMPDHSGDPPRPAMRIDFEFVSGAGYGIVQREVPLDLPENYEFAMGIRGSGGCPANDLEFKLLDAPKGENVWWCKRRAFEFPDERTVLRYRKRDISFAWGPSGGKPLTAISKIEIAIASSSGGKGSVWLDSLTFRELPPVRPYEGRTTARASSEVEGHAALSAIDGDAKTAWRAAGDDAAPALTMDFGAVREFGGVTIDWGAEAAPKSAEVETSVDGETWVRGGLLLAEKLPTRSYVRIPDAEARYVRVKMTPAMADAKRAPVGIAGVRVEPLEFGRSMTDTWKAIAAEHPRGYFPRYFTGEQSFWTVAGVPGDEHEVLVNADGMIEVEKGGFSLEPFIMNERGRLFTWAEGDTRQKLDDQGFPTPRVNRAADGLDLEVAIEPVVRQSGERAMLVVYSIKNLERTNRKVRFVLAVRPFQVNPPWQFLNTPGGAARVTAIRQDRGDIVVNGRQRVMLIDHPQAFGAQTFAAGEIIDAVVSGKLPMASVVSDEMGNGASAAAVYELSLGPTEVRAVRLILPLGQAERPLWIAAADDRLMAPTPAGLASILGTRSLPSPDQRIVLKLPPFADYLRDSIRANLGYIFVNMDGPGFQPGSRSYERSWIRDGSMTGAACLEFGLMEEPRKFVEWYEKYQFPSGKVPCVVDKRGPDPVPENDSHGQLIYAIAENFRFHPDTPWLRARFPAVKAAVKYIQELRAQRMTDEFKDATKTRQEPGKAAVPVTAFYGLVPESISHEGYSAKPMHSYWDQFFVLKGLKDAAFIAEALGENELAKQWRDLAADFRKCLLESIRITAKTHGIDYIPGCVELGDFDATSTAVGITVCGELEHMPRELVDATFDRYWAYFVKRRDDPNFEWIDYTPYELRVVGAMVMLGHRDRAMQMLDWFMKDQLPAGWHQWAEIVHKDRKAGKWIGDMPHTWVGSDFLRSVRSMFVYEGGPGDSIVLLAGVPQTWLDSSNGVEFELPTHRSKLKMKVKSGADGWTHATLESDRPIGQDIWIRPPSLSSPDKVRVNDKPTVVRDGMIPVDTLPATIVYIR
ncbi:MAG: discoidin domain-containing protein [Phycisphaerales bacterium]